MAENNKKSQNKPRIRNVRARRKTVNPIAAAVERIYDKSAPLLIGEALLFIGAAVLLFIWPVAILTLLTFIIGAALIFFGLWRMIGGFVTSRNIGGGWVDVIFGLINILLGLLFCIYPVGSIIGVTYIFVFLFAFKALKSLLFAINMVRARFGHYWFDLIVALILCGLAAALLFWPMAGAIAMVYYLAVAMIFYALADIYMFVELVRLRREVRD